MASIHPVAYPRPLPRSNGATVGSTVSSRLPQPELIKPSLAGSFTIHLVDQYGLLTPDLSQLLGTQELVLRRNVELLEPVVLLLHGQVLLLAEPRVLLLTLKVTAKLGLLCGRLDPTLLHCVVASGTEGVTLHLELSVSVTLTGRHGHLLLGSSLGLTLSASSLTGLSGVLKTLETLLPDPLLVRSGTTLCHVLAGRLTHKQSRLWLHVLSRHI